MESRKYHDSHVTRNEEITSALVVFGRTFALLSNFASQMTLNGCTQWLSARYRIRRSPLPMGLEIFRTTPKPGFSGWRDAPQLHGRVTYLIFPRNSSPRFVIAIRSLFSCKVRIYNTRGITSPYKMPTDSHVSREHLGERNNSRASCMYLYRCDLLTFARVFNP